MKRWPLAVLVIPLAVSAPAGAQTPAAGELVVNTVAVDNQLVPSLSMDARGNFVVVWQSNLQDGSGFGIIGQRFDPAGVRVGTEFA